MDALTQTLLTAILSSSLAATLVGVITQRYTARIQQQVKLRFDQLATTLTSQRAWKERALSELLGPVNMQLDRTERAFQRYNDQNLFLEAQVIRQGNQTIRDLLLAKGHLIPPDLLEDAGRLIAHYDRWLEEFERVRGGKEPKLDETFVFVGVGKNPIPFPSDSAERFQARFRELWRELYGNF
jgi:hypothetical protein